jgi:hypothetical protein
MTYCSPEFRKAKNLGPRNNVTGLATWQSFSS